MTEENYNYRTSQTLLRNQFPGKGTFKIPITPKFQEKPGDFDDLLLIGFDKTHLEDQNHLDRMVHFFLYDYRFERVWKNPDNDIEKLSRYRAVLSPDFSMYLEMAPVMQLYNVFRNRWCGAYWASKGLRVIPTVNWGDESTFDFCFEGIERGSVVAVSTYMASEHDNRQDQKEWFMAGYNEMLRRIEPEKIICYNTPFPEMQGNIIYVDYERSSWRYMNYERSFRKEDLESFKIGGVFPPFCDTIEPFLIGKGGGSAYGGRWKPNPDKPNEVILQGPPNTIQKVFIRTKKEGYWTLVKYNAEGWAIKTRHFTDHGNSSKHSNPHDKEIAYDPHTGAPDFHKYPDVNYWFAEYPDGAPEFKHFQRGIPDMEVRYFTYSPEAWRFKTISEFKNSVNRGAEINFEWNGREYHICPVWPNGEVKYCITPLDTQQDTVYQNADDMLEYIIDNTPLRDIVTKMEVTDRTL